MAGSSKQLGCHGQKSARACVRAQDQSCQGAWLRNFCALQNQVRKGFVMRDDARWAAISIRSTPHTFHYLYECANFRMRVNRPISEEAIHNKLNLGGRIGPGYLSSRTRDWKRFVMR